GFEPLGSGKTELEARRFGALRQFVNSVAAQGQPACANHPHGPRIFPLSSVRPAVGTRQPPPLLPLLEAARGRGWGPGPLSSRRISAARLGRWAMRLPVSGWVKNRLSMSAPESGLTIYVRAMAGLRSAATFTCRPARAAIFPSAEARASGSPVMAAPSRSA